MYMYITYVMSYVPFCSYRKYILDFRKQILLLITILSHILLFWFIILFFYCMTLCISAVLLSPSVCHVGALFPDG